MGAELAVDVGKVVAERVWGNAQPAGDGGGVAAFGEKLQDPALLFGEGLDLSMVGGVARERDDLPGGLHHPLQQIRVAALEEAEELAAFLNFCGMQEFSGR